MYNTDNEEERIIFAFNAAESFKGECTKNEDRESETDSVMSDCITSLKHGHVETLGEDVLCLVTFEHVKIKHKNKVKRRHETHCNKDTIPFMSHSTGSPIGSSFKSLNIQDIYVTKINTVEIDKIVHEDEWYCVRSKVHREVKQNAIILLVAGGHGDKGSQSISSLKNKIIGLFQCSAIIRDGDEIKRFSKRYKLEDSAKNKKIMIIESKLWFKKPIMFKNYLNNGFVQPFEKAPFPARIVNKIIKKANKVWNFTLLKGKQKRFYGFWLIYRED